jgi:hypothetical protein
VGKTRLILGFTGLGDGVKPFRRVDHDQFLPQHPLMASAQRRVAVGPGGVQPLPKIAGIRGLAVTWARSAGAAAGQSKQEVIVALWRLLLASLLVDRHTDQANSPGEVFPSSAALISITSCFSLSVS